MKELEEVPEAPWEVASNPRAYPQGRYLYLDGRKYLRPVLTPEEFQAKAAEIMNVLEPPQHTFWYYLRLVVWMFGLFVAFIVIALAAATLAVFLFSLPFVILLGWK